jgi:hypothetical protein
LSKTTSNFWTGEGCFHGLSGVAVGLDILDAVANIVPRSAVQHRDSRWRCWSRRTASAGTGSNTWITTRTI